MAAKHDSGETEHERLERRWSEQLSELRVAQTGTQIMTGFLLTIPFQPLFESTTTLEKALYLGLIVTATLATVMAIAPVSFHRILFGYPGAKARIVAVTQTLMRIALTLVALVLSGTIALVFNLVLDAAAGLVGFVVALVLIWPYRNLDDEHCEEANRGWRKFLWVNFIAGAIVSLMIITIWQRG